ncbi:MAG: hypothetical protein ACREFS_12685 [Acetobacteraceae bacterium]
MTAMTDALIIPVPRRIADNETRPAVTLSGTLGSIFRSIAEAVEEAMEGASGARCRYPSAD